MHYQTSPHEEDKLVTCIKGAIYDVIIDLRADSPTYRQWCFAELSEKNRMALYIPKGFAHGFQTLTDDALVLYQISKHYHPECARTIRWDDPVYRIAWPPCDRRILSEKDRND